MVSEVSPPRYFTTLMSLLEPLNGAAGQNYIRLTIRSHGVVRGYL
jgi:hypothetical protein